MFFIGSSFFTFEPVDVAIPDIPLGDLTPDVFVDGRAGCCSSLPGFGVDGLDLSGIVVEFVSH